MKKVDEYFEPFEDVENGKELTEDQKKENKEIALKRRERMRAFNKENPNHILNKEEFLKRFNSREA